MKAITSIVAGLMLLATAVLAGDECHNPSSVPIVTNWTIVAGPGTIVIDATLAGEPCCPPSEFYLDRGGSHYDGVWWMSIAIGQIDSMYYDYYLELTKATVTDSTFHAEVPYDAGSFKYRVCAMGTDYHAQECSCPYEMDGTITILPAMTPARRASLGRLKAAYR